jgi:hypothetical protein
VYGFRLLSAVEVPYTQINTSAEAIPVPNVEQALSTLAVASNSTIQTRKENSSMARKDVTSPRVGNRQQGIEQHQQHRNLETWFIWPGE